MYSVSSGIGNLYSDGNIPSLSSYSSLATNNLSLSNVINQSTVANEMDSSHLFALSLLNQALNVNIVSQSQVDKHLQFQSLHIPDKIAVNKHSNYNTITSNLIAEYDTLKETIDKSGLLSPSERLFSTHRGQCYWSNCFFQSDIEENFKKHLKDCHPFTSSALAQMEISLQISLHLSNMLLKEQNHLYNMLLHLDHTLKALPPEISPTNDQRYLALLINKFKQIQNLSHCSPCFDKIPSELWGSQLPVFRHQGDVKQNFPRNLIDSLSSTLVRTHSISQPIASHPFLSNQITQSTDCYSPIINSNVTINSNIDILPRFKSSNSQLCDTENKLSDIHSYSLCTEFQSRQTNSASFTHIHDKLNCIVENRSVDQQCHVKKNVMDRNYYRQYNVRPSVSYVNLIKTAILESPKRELSLNEIYVWMQSEFLYFRDKEQKWKNAIRHNLSLHKCFQRKHGKLWTFNENEYNIKKSRNRFQSNVPLPKSDTMNGDYFGVDDGVKDENDLIDEDRDSKIESNYNDDNVVDNDWSRFVIKSSTVADNCPPDDT